MAKRQQIREVSPTEEIQKAREAESLLNHPMIDGALKAIEAHYFEAWLSSEIADVKGREMAYRMMKASGQFRYLLQEHIESGTLSEQALAEARIQQGLTEDD